VHPNRASDVPHISSRRINYTPYLDYAADFFRILLGLSSGVAWPISGLLLLERDGNCQVASTQGPKSKSQFLSYVLPLR